MRDHIWWDQNERSNLMGSKWEITFDEIKMRDQIDKIKMKTNSIRSKWGQVLWDQIWLFDYFGCCKGENTVTEKSTTYSHCELQNFLRYNKFSPHNEKSLSVFKTGKNCLKMTHDPFFGVVFFPFFFSQT